MDKTRQNSSNSASSAASGNSKESADIDIVQDGIFEGALLKSQYKIGRLIDQGSFGKVFKVTDT